MNGVRDLKMSSLSGNFRIFAQRGRSQGDNIQWLSPSRGVKFLCTEDLWSATKGFEGVPAKPSNSHQEEVILRRIGNMPACDCGTPAHTFPLPQSCSINLITLPTHSRWLNAEKRSRICHSLSPSLCLSLLSSLSLSLCLSRFLWTYDA